MELASNAELVTIAIFHSLHLQGYFAKVIHLKLVINTMSNKQGVDIIINKVHMELNQNVTFESHISYVPLFHQY